MNCWLYLPAQAVGLEWREIAAKLMELFRVRKDRVSKAAACLMGWLPLEMGGG